MIDTRKKIKKEIFRQLYQYKSQAIEVKSQVNIDSQVGALVTACTAEKIHTLLIKIFKLLWANHSKKTIMDNMSRFFKLVKLHLNQLKRLKQTNVKLIQAFFTDAARIVYSEMRRY